ncbi:MAG: hypothetical protein ACP5N2_07215 [Candidatus Nanoarchaeia archaeon]
MSLKCYETVKRYMFSVNQKQVVFEKLKVNRMKIQNDFHNLASSYPRKALMALDFACKKNVAILQ